jgi:hypothetical protein
VLDRQGLEMSGSVEAVAAYDRAIDHLVRFRPELLDDIAASTLDPSCAMGATLSAYVSLLSTEGAGATRARAVLANAAPGPALVARERAHRAVLERWVAGDMHRAGALLNRLSVEYPRDLLALYVGHQIDFFTGNAANLRDRIGRALSEWSGEDPGLGFLLGMYAFGLEECNQYSQAAETGFAAMESHPDDVWALHAVVHTFEMRGRAGDGRRFLEDRRGDWASDNFLRVHTAWHAALFALEGDDASGALRVYDEVLRTTDSGDVAFELLDAASLLWRLALEDTPVGDRWRSLADAWSRVLVPGHYPFNDMHAVMAYVGAGDPAEARRVVAALADLAERGDRSTSSWQMTTRVGLPVCRGLLAFAAGDYQGTVDDLLAVRGRLHEFGGSHAQRDVVERTLLEAAIRAGEADLARALVSERISVREASTYAWSKRARLAARTGDREGEVRASVRADALAARALGA